MTRLVLVGLALLAWITLLAGMAVLIMFAARLVTVAIGAWS